MLSEPKLLLTNIDLNKANKFYFFCLCWTVMLRLKYLYVYIYSHHTPCHQGGIQRESENTYKSGEFHREWFSRKRHVYNMMPLVCCSDSQCYHLAGVTFETWELQKGRFCSCYVRKIKNNRCLSFFISSDNHSISSWNIVRVEFCQFGGGYLHFPFKQCQTF